jgi:hypothetical protein
VTRTEERLKDYLGAVAESVRPDTTPPLVSPAAWASHRGWRAWTIPLAAAASVLAVVALTVTLAGKTTHPASPSRTGAAALPFLYRVEFEGNPGQPVVRSVSTGAVVARVRNPLGGSGGPMNVAAAPDDRTFYAAYLQAPYDNKTPNRYTIYSFRVLRQGQVTKPAEVKGGLVTFGHLQKYEPALAVSPDGGRLALALTVTGSGDTAEPQWVANQIVVIDLRTGVHRVWHGGLNRAGSTVTVTTVSWADNGRSLYFLATWCAKGGHGAACLVSDPVPDSTTQVRALNLSTNGGSLDASRVLITRPGAAQSMVAAPGGLIDLLTLSGPHPHWTDPQILTITQYSAANGAVRGVLYRHDYETPPVYLAGDVFLTADPSGRYPLLVIGLQRNPGTTANTVAFELGWIHDGSFHTLESHGNWLPAAW